MTKIKTKTIYLPTTKKDLRINKELTQEMYDEINECIIELKKELNFHRERKVLYRDLLQIKKQEIKTLNEYIDGGYYNRH